MLNMIRFLVLLPSLLFIVQGFRWLAQPAEIAAEFGMPLLTGIGASTQIGDLGSFFFIGGILMILGLLPQKSYFLLAPALLVGGAGFFRIWAFILGYADLAVQFIFVEAVMTAILLAGFYNLPRLEARASSRAGGGV